MIENFTVDISDIDPSKKDNELYVMLSRMGKGITNVFKQALADEMGDMRDMSKRLLEEASESHSGKKYWTGLLQSAIKSEITEDKVGSFKGTVGVDLSVAIGKHKVADYAIPVEVGHITGYGNTDPVPAYKYMENAYLRSRDPMVRRIKNKLSIVIEAKTSYGKGARNLATGRYAKDTRVRIK